ncbi:alternative ribosome rescue aminoacyl-tRNA hydrolase ArfB [Segeticoccus rhizosphaerae]|jgi:ribosome-associated protein|uniref:alternative ribosome rescue aminoacyl-tRNA hydrolase ArfB n=1 Tax=Segeticoccus rhizosphaerae TaxID=1104777 RepID=UPI0012648AAE|nr:alternative ribosome rescue aminoacyl-tRNA hydrolase ArfB [Segeticoccus rhizosphaerae]
MIPAKRTAVGRPGDDLAVRAGPGLPHGLVLPATELEEQFARSSGPGGQKVNTSDTKVQLRYAVGESTALDDRQRARALVRLGDRFPDGVVLIIASEHRSQHQNRVAARQRLASLLREALAPPPPARRATRPTRSSQRRRLQAKRIRSQTKAARGRVRPDE